MNIEVPPPIGPRVPGSAPSAQESPDAEYQQHRQPPNPGSQDTSRKLIIILLSLVSVLLIAVLVLLSIFLFGGQQTPAEPDEPAVPQEPLATATILSFTADSEIAQCSSDSAGTTATVVLNWSATDVLEAALAVGGTEIDALAAPSQASLPAEATGYTGIPYPCDQASRVFSLTVVGEDEARSTVSLSIERELPPPPPAPPVLNSATWQDGLDYAICPSFSNSSIVGKGVSWSSSGGGTVTLSISQSDSSYPDANASYTRIAQELPANGSHSVDINCGTTGYSTYFTVKVVVTNAGGSATKYIQGNTAS